MSEKPRFKPKRAVAQSCLAEWNLRDLFWDAAVTADLYAKKRRNKARDIRDKNPGDKQAAHSAGVLERRARAFQLRAELLRELADHVSADVEPNPKRELRNAPEQVRQVVENTNAHV